MNNLFIVTLVFVFACVGPSPHGGEIGSYRQGTRDGDADVKESTGETGIQTGGLTLGGQTLQVDKGQWVLHGQ